jgi:Xaa-Pro aminopeptidase
MTAAGLNALLVSEPHNIFYLCGSNGGYTGAKIALVLGKNKSILLIDQRYVEEARIVAHADRIDTWKSSGYTDLSGILREIGAESVGFEATHITVKQYERMTKEFEDMMLVGASGAIEPVREIKDEIEIERISEAAAIADKAFEHILEMIKPGVSETEIALELDYFMRKNGARQPSFDTIAASGLNSAVPHATPSDKKIESGDFVKLDFGAVVEGYHSDMTRSVVAGKASERQKEIYYAVKQAQETALDSVAPGRVCGDIDAIARDIIAEKGFGEYFVHNLGHGVGLQVHESPTLGKNCESVLQPGMVVTVEPGIYVGGFGGVRIEDLVVVTGSGHSVLSHATKELLEI